MKFVVIVGIALFAGTWFFLEKIKGEFEAFYRELDKEANPFEEDIYSFGDTSTT